MPKAVEEVLRFDGPIKVLHRWVLDEIELRGRTIRPGDRVFLALAGANRDPEHFADPDVVDVTRYPNRHVAFGRGIHACIGAQLARLEMRYALDAIVHRLPELRLQEGAAIEHHASLAARALKGLHVTVGR
jgi:cytochrome P450